ncbi:MAG: sulfatase-like hydrolase/transferase [Planctomycetes bacterium]|nr:sulfatase-like hydrolase/transferase [Planctomycetota bacterium]
MAIKKSSLVALALVCIASLAAGASKPNFLFILVDDLGWADISPNNPKTFYDTPNIARFATTGLRFTQAYAACPVCSPTRASLMTGQYPVRTGITDYIGAAQPDKWKRPTKMLPAPYAEELALDQVTMAEALKAGGYATFFAGKWHLGPKGHWPEDQGFDINMGGIDRGGPYGGGKYFSPYGNPRLPDGPPGEHLPDRLATETVKFMTEHKDGPFLAYLAFYSVHIPLMGREDLVAKYKEKKKDLPPVSPQFMADHARSIRQVQDHVVYAAMVDAMDQAVGKVLKALDDLNIADNTVVVFFSDNGGVSSSEGHPTSNLPLRGGKGWLYEGGVREPCIIRAPGLTPAGQTSDTPIISTDFYPTFVSLAGLPAHPEQTKDGLILTPVLRDPHASLHREALYWHYPHYGNQGGFPGSAIRKGDWKLIRAEEDGHVELYNIADDIGEHHDLANQQPKIAAELSAKLDAWLISVNAKHTTPNPNYNEQALEKFEQRAYFVPED